MSRKTILYFSKEKHVFHYFSLKTFWNLSRTTDLVAIIREEFCLSKIGCRTFELWHFFSILHFLTFEWNIFPGGIFYLVNPVKEWSLVLQKHKRIPLQEEPCLSFQGWPLKHKEQHILEQTNNSWVAMGWYQLKQGQNSISCPFHCVPSHGLSKTNTFVVESF